MRMPLRSAKCGGDQVSCICVGVENAPVIVGALVGTMDKKVMVMIRYCVYKKLDY